METDVELLKVELAKLQEIALALYEENRTLREQVEAADEVLDAVDRWMEIAP